MPEALSNAATVSEVNGRVQKIESSPFGGHVITVEGKRHRAARERMVTVKVGDQVPVISTSLGLGS